MAYKPKHDYDVNTSGTDRTEAERRQMKGDAEHIHSLDEDADSPPAGYVGPGGYVGHSRGGADIRFVTLAEQDQKRDAAARTKAETVPANEKTFEEYIKNRSILVADQAKLGRLAAGTVNEVGLSKGLFERFGDKVLKGHFVEFTYSQSGSGQRGMIVLFTIPSKEVYRLNIDFSNLPESLKDIEEKLNNAKGFLTEVLGKYLKTTDVFAAIRPSDLIGFGDLEKFCDNLEKA